MCNNIKKVLLSCLLYLGVPSLSGCSIHGNNRIDSQKDADVSAKGSVVHIAFILNV